MKYRKLLPFCCAAMMCGCTPQGVLQHDMATLPDDGWRRRDTLTFHIDSAARCAWLCVRIDATYPYTALSLLAGGDTLTIPTDSMTGRTLRQCEYALPKVQPGEFHIIHLMRDAPLHGVREVGIKTAVKPLH